MKFFLSCSLSLLASGAFAHDSLAPHSHPHDVSIFPDLSAMLVAALVVGAGFIAFRLLQRR